MLSLFSFQVNGAREFSFRALSIRTYEQSREPINSFHTK